MFTNHLVPFLGSDQRLPNVSPQFHPARLLFHRKHSSPILFTFFHAPGRSIPLPTRGTTTIDHHHKTFGALIGPNTDCKELDRSHGGKLENTRSANCTIFIEGDRYGQRPRLSIVAYLRSRRTTELQSDRRSTSCARKKELNPIRDSDSILKITVTRQAR